ncbi:hypothetical protein CHGG_06002 [Chaetomium globosum CBS 148.51]|uniref:COP9 signalosome complex subunit 4 n=1 Tax=Chaetomium globosum (strain ATCC 6205 / CBS 148.51 / DSM 1962 / NBRC 6347 / NRRL 1970) TaxID=306901 RepID=Q2H5R3_CHAGB|nr:uncharacterized protein CHGG_06002 [Chaetomium globosum CBS 148.51]EAQ89383.1 hypothetical protein CHGG_06002 [Chaetomium globosum CBS 148.51]
MASPQVAAALEEAGKSQDVTGYLNILENTKSTPNPDSVAADLTAFIDAVLTGNLGLVNTRTLVTDFIAALRALDNHDLWLQVGQHAIRTIPTTALSSSLLEQSAALRELVATAHEANEDFLDAAKMLSDIPLDSSQRRVGDAEKAAIWVRIVRNYLEVDDSTTAERYLNKLKNVMHDVADAELNLHFRAVGGAHPGLEPPDERLHTLAMAIKCAILAPAGPLRGRALAHLYKDDRSAGLEEHGILEKMFFDRLLSTAEVDKFAQGLAPHQLAKTSDGSTVLAKAVVEHNLLSASRLYSNIGFDELGLLLGLDGEKAEDTTARMVEQGRLVGSIDQIDRIIWFEGGDASGEKGSGRAETAVGKEMRRWDANVQALAEDVERLTDALQAEFPEFVAAQIAV